jgi:hypothetical protein
MEAEVGRLPGLGACSHRCGATAHDAVHGAFMTLPPYTGIREVQVRHLERDSKPWHVGKCREAAPPMMLPSPL